MENTPVDVPWEVGREANLLNWEDRVAIHETSYGLDAFDDPEYLSRVIRDDLAVMAPYLPGGSIAGLDVVHLQCHIGTDTVSLARAGAHVVGVDFSPSALSVADRLAKRCGVSAEWVETDVLDAAAAVRATGATADNRFDVVYTSIGTICWLNDLDRWAAQIVGLLRPGGLFYIRDGHPSLYVLDENADHLAVTYRYFPNGQPEVWDDNSTYVGDGIVAHERTYEWPHPLSEIVNALIGAGLQIVRLDEGQILSWQFSPRMVEVDGGWAWPGEERLKVPCTYTIIARLGMDLPGS